MSRVAQVIWIAGMVGFAGSVAFSQPLAERIPADAMAYIGWQGADELGPAYQQSRLKAMLDESGFGELFGPFIDRLFDRLAGKNPNDVAKWKMILDLFQPAWHCPMAIYLGKVQLVEGGPPKAELALIVQARDKAAALRNQLLEITPLGQPGSPLSVSVQGQYLLIHYGDLGGYGNLTALLNGESRPSLKTAPRFVKALAGNQPGSIGMFYMDLPKVCDVVDAVIAFQVKQAKQYNNMALPTFVTQWPRIRDGLALRSIHSISMSMGFVDRDFATSVFINAPAPRTGLAGAFGEAPVTEDMLAMIPSTSIAAGASMFDLKGLARTIIDIIGQIDPQVRQNIEEALAKIAENSQVHPINDLLGSLGSQWVYYTDPNVAGPSFLGTVMVNRLRDPKQLEQGIGVVMAMSNAMIKEHGDEAITLRLRTSEVAGRTIYYLSVPYVKPSILIEGDRLYLGMFPQVVVAAAEQARKPHPAITANPRFQAARRWMGDRKFQSAEFVDVETVLPGVYANALLFSQLGLGFADLFGIQSPTMLVPPLHRIRPLLGPASSFSWSDDQGIYFHSRSPFPGSGLVTANPQYAVGAMALAAGILMPSLSHARHAARKAVSMVNMRAIYQSCMIYAMDNKEQFPPDLGTLVAQKILAPKIMMTPQNSDRKPPPGMAPKDMGPWVNQNTDYLYYPGAGVNSPADAIILMENPAKLNTRKGLNVLFGDGHSEFMNLQQFREALRIHNERAKQIKGMTPIADPFAGRAATPPRRVR